MTTNAALEARRKAAVAPGVGSATAVYAHTALGAEIWDVEGRRYIDFASGIGVVNMGHRHPLVMARALEQAQRFTHTSFQVVPYEAYVAVAEKLNALAPGRFAKKTLLVTTGAEALENAVKIARIATGKPGIIAFYGGYHGRTNLTLTMTGKVQPYKANFGPTAADVYRAPAPAASWGISVEEALKHLRILLKTDAEPARVAAVVIEPVLGEGGYIPMPAEFLQALRQICDEHGLLLVADEVQTGFARTGKWFAVEHSGVVPDLITVAKSLAGGWPLAGVIGRAEIMDRLPPGSLGGTYGGNPVACAAALGAIEAIEQDRLLDKALFLGKRMLDRLGELQRASEGRIGEVRGLGAMVAVELVTADGRPDPDLAKALVAEALARGLILLTCGMHGNALRLIAPVSASEALVEEGLGIIAASLQAVLRKAA
jgi:4-aminobutyrate aminotransferase/(S)-3-amino-2-methylpropionate transaminase